MAQCYWYKFTQYISLWNLVQLMFKHLINSQIEFAFPLLDSLPTTKTRSALQIYPCKSSPCTALLNCPENDTKTHITTQGSKLNFQEFTLHCSYHLEKSCTRPPATIHHFLFFWKIFLCSVHLLCYFPEDCSWIDWALIAQPCQAQGGISPSLLPLPCPPELPQLSVISEEQWLAIH